MNTSKRKTTGLGTEGWRALTVFQLSKQEETEAKEAWVFV